MRPSRLALVLIVLGAGGCVPTCTETCEKWLDCGIDTERVALEECVDSCIRQDAQYELWEDEAKAELFDEHRQCIGRSSCDEIADGECYDPELFLF